MKIISISELEKPDSLLEFDCGVTELNLFLQKYAKQNDKKNIGKTFLFLDETKIIGFVTLCTAQLEFEEMPDVRLPKYPIPALRIARLAVDKKYQGNHFGSQILKFVFKKALLISFNVGVKLILVDAKESSKTFYEHHEFVSLPNRKLSYVFPIEKVLKVAI